MTFTLINASAGSGKTYTLTHEIASRIAGGLQPSQLIATTFTTKAADELAERVRRTLLEDGQVDAARGIDSALIGTVNAVSGQLLREFALDAGISPDVQVLDEERQRAAFSAAIDEAAARAGAQASDLLARTEHDGEEDPAQPFGAKPSWRSHVRELAGRARTNRIGAQQLRDAAGASWEQMRGALVDAGVPVPSGESRTAAWLSRLDAALAGLRADLEASESPAPGTTPPLPPRSAGAVAKHLPALEQLRRDLGRGARAPWSAWARIAKVARRRAGDPEAKGYVWGKDTDAALLGLAQEIDDGLLADPALHADAEALIRLVMHTAADSLEAYQQFKDELGLIDFIDQEVRTLELIRSSGRAREAVRSRFSLLAVDEFQDTSPVQLALFLELSRLVEDKIWVGDPKQAIYGFRDADPALMLGIIEQIEQGTTDLGPGEVSDLEHSWRSQEDVLALVNTVFPQVFPHMPRERVVLTAAQQAVAARQRAGRAPGRIEAWTPHVDGRFSQAKHARAVADGVRALVDGSPAAGLEHAGAVDPGEIAVLVRSNAQAQEVIGALAERGVPASGQGAPLLASREGRLVRAALAVTLDRADTLALTELVDLLADHARHEDWFARLASAPDAAARGEEFERWWQDPVLAGLRALRDEAVSLTPVEMITALVDALDLPERIRSWSEPEQRLRSLDALRRLAADYADQARADSSPITLTGLRGVLDASQDGPDLGGIPGTVWVGTIHAAKGLEWSHVVVMLETSVKERVSTWGSFIVPAPQLDVTSPLDGREARYWPKLLDGFAPLTEALGASEHARRRAEAEREESGRLQYVALTRAADVTVLSGEGRAPALDALVEGEEPLLRWEAGDPRIHVSDGAGGTALPAVLRSTDGSPADGPEQTTSRSPLAATDLPDGHSTRADAQEHAAAPSARFQASGVASREGLGTVHPPLSIGPALVEHGGRDWDRVGEAVHAYLSLPLPALGEAQREQAATRLVERWAVSRAIGAEALQRAGEAWHDFLREQLPGAEQLTEQPITWWNEDDQVMEGWIDALLRLPQGAGHVLVDHKTYPGDDPVGHVREHHLGQLDTYAQALQAAGFPVSRVLIHLPLRGEVVEVTLARLTETERADA